MLVRFALVALVGRLSLDAGLLRLHRVCQLVGDEPVAFPRAGCVLASPEVHVATRRECTSPKLNQGREKIRRPCARARASKIRAELRVSTRARIAPSRPRRRSSGFRLGLRVALRAGAGRAAAGVASPALAGRVLADRRVDLWPRRPQACARRHVLRRGVAFDPRSRRCRLSPVGDRRSSVARGANRAHEYVIGDVREKLLRFEPCFMSAAASTRRGTCVQSPTTPDRGAFVPPLRQRSRSLSSFAASCSEPGTNESPPRTRFHAARI